MSDKFDYKKLPKELRDIYEEQVDTEHKSIVDKLLGMEEDEEVNDSERPRPNYDEGSVDENMFPTLPKAKELLISVMSGNGYIHVLEGGARGGKDVFGLLIWTIYLMQTPHKTHLALGKSLEHALLTILHSSGFGLYYTIPNGIFVRNSDSGAQRGIYKFKDMYGVEKEILFYGNDKKNDNEKYQGFTIGSTYVNEGMTQHLDGINQAIQRMASSHNHLMLVTQNPKGQAHPFYTVFEKDKLVSPEQVSELEYVRTMYRDDFLEKEDKILKSSEKDKRDFVRKYCLRKNVPNVEYLNDEDSQTLYLGIRDIDFYYDKQISDIYVRDFYDKAKSENHFMNFYSMKKVANFNKGGNNPNGVINSYDYTYAHFTVDDNVSLTQMQRDEFKNIFKKGSALFLQKVQGIRKTAERAIYKEFTQKNIIDVDIMAFNKSSNTMRFISIDVGFNHMTVLLDGEVDYNTGTVFVLQEKYMDFRISKGTVEHIENAFWDLVRSRKDRKQPDMLIIDPSHVATINHFLDRGIDVTPANNSSLMPRSKDKRFANQNQQKETLGIDLVKYGFDIGRILIQQDCFQLIAEIESYEFEYNENTGKLVIKKVNDDGVDALRYAINTTLGGTQYWEKGGEIDGEENVISQILGDEGSQRKEWNMDRAIDEAQRQLNQEIGGDAIFGFGNDFDRNPDENERDDGLWFLGKNWL